MRASSILASLSLSVALTSSSPTKRQATTSVYKISASGANTENLAVRSNGQILTTRFDVGEVWTVDPVAKTGSKLVTIPGVTCTAGITEVSPDVFAVIGGNYSSRGGNKAGSWGVYKMDMTKTPVTATVIKQFADSTMFNGLTTLDNSTVLIAEGKGSIIRLDVNTAASSVALQDATMAPPSGAPIPLGIDGVRFYNGTVYYTNIFKNSFHKVAVDATGKATGAYTTISTSLPGDDFSFGPDGSAYVAAQSSNRVVKVSPSGQLSNGPSISGLTSTAFGRTDKDKTTVYVSTNSATIYSFTAT